MKSSRNLLLKLGVKLSFSFSSLSSFIRFFSGLTMPYQEWKNFRLAALIVLSSFSQYFSFITNFFFPSFYFQMSLFSKLELKRFLLGQHQIVFFRLFWSWIFLYVFWLILLPFWTFIISQTGPGNFFLDNGLIHLLKLLHFRFHREIFFSMLIDTLPKPTLYWTNHFLCPYSSSIFAFFESLLNLSVCDPTDRSYQRTFRFRFFCWYYFDDIFGIWMCRS